MKEFKKSFKKHWSQFISEGKEAISEFKNPKTRYKQIPNLFTTSRLFSPFFIIPAALTGNLALTATFVAGFALTDAADGYFARKYNATSEFGRKLDALTDKLFVGSLLIPLSINNPVLISLLTMEGVISAINVHSQLTDNKPATKIIGKIKTAFLFFTIFLNFVSLATTINPAILNTFLVSTLGLQTASALKYFKNELSKKEKKEQTKNNSKIELTLEDEKEKEKTNSKVHEITPTNIGIQIEVDLTPSQKVKELRNFREQLCFEEKEEAPKEKKIETN